MLQDELRPTIAGWPRFLAGADEFVVMSLGRLNTNPVVPLLTAAPNFRVPPILGFEYASSLAQPANFAECAKPSRLVWVSSSRFYSDRR